MHLGHSGIVQARVTYVKLNSVIGLEYHWSSHCQTEETDRHMYMDTREE